MALTWRDVQAPNTSDASATFTRAGQTIQQSIAGLGNVVSGFGNQQQQANTDAALAQISQATSTSELDALSNPEALGQYGNFNRAQIAQATSNLRQQFSQREQQESQFAETQGLARDTLEANIAYRNADLALQKDRNDVYNRSIGLQADAAQERAKAAAAYDLGMKEGGNFTSVEEVNQYLAKKQQELFDSGSTAVEVNEYSRGIRERFQGMIANSSGSSLADQVLTQQQAEIEALAGQANAALETNSSINNPDNAVVSLLPSLNSKITNTQDAIKILTDQFGSGSRSDVAKYISEGRSGNSPIPLNVLVASALQSAGDNTSFFGWFGDEFFDAGVATTQARRVATGIQDGTIIRAGEITDEGTTNIATVATEANNAVTKIADATRIAGAMRDRFGEASEQYKNAKASVDEAKAIYAERKATLQKLSDNILKNSGVPSLTIPKDEEGEGTKELQPIPQTRLGGSGLGSRYRAIGTSR